MTVIKLTEKGYERHETTIVWEYENWDLVGKSNGKTPDVSPKEVTAYLKAEPSGRWSFWLIGPIDQIIKGKSLVGDEAIKQIVEAMKENDLKEAELEVVDHFTGYITKSPVLYGIRIEITLQTGREEVLWIGSSERSKRYMGARQALLKQTRTLGLVLESIEFE